MSELWNSKDLKLVIDNSLIEGLYWADDNHNPSCLFHFDASSNKLSFRLVLTSASYKTILPMASTGKLVKVKLSGSNGVILMGKCYMYFAGETKIGLSLPSQGFVLQFHGYCNI